jgi:ATP-dependent helicase HrpB
MTTQYGPLPIDSALPALLAALRERSSVVLEAPPGAGKTTRVPLALLDEPWLAGQKIVMLEPRRLAARAAARHMAGLLGEAVGGRVGYRVRLDTRVSARTRVEVVTEGVLTRMLQSDASLEGVGLVVFDEFHERSLPSDLGLALALETQAVLRPELRVLVMSATIEGDRVAALLGGAPVVRSAGRSFPVETRHVERRPDAWVEPQVAALVRRALGEEPAGDLLVFLPGTAEIRRVHALLDGSALPPGVRVAPLYGNLSAADQDAAIRPAPAGERKVVLATSIAETSLTIEGVRVVVDAGLARVPRFSPRTGMTRLETVRVSRAAADQRRGRAGRLAPGVCYRLWGEPEHQHLVPFPAPEIREADLAPLALELAAAGVAADALRWLDAPPPAAMAQARELLAQLGALGADGRVTAHGRRMAELGLHPRLAHMALRGESLGAAGTACDLAALLSERDVLRAEPGAPGDADVALRLELLRGGPRAAAGAMTVDHDAVRRVRAEAAEWRRQLRAGRGGDDPAAAGVLLAFAYPDRIGRRRADATGRFVLRNGLGARLDPGQPLAAAELIVAAELDGRRPESRVFLAAPLSLGDLERHFGEQIERATVVAWDDEARAVRARRQERLGAILLADAPARDADPDAVADALLAYIRREGAAALPWSDAARRLQQRVAFLRRLSPDRWPDLSDGALLESLGGWLAPHLAGVRRADELARVDLAGALLDALGWEQRRALDADAPTHAVVPSGSRVPIDYADPAAPVLAVRLQELFGLAATPAVAGGRVPLTLHLLSPARRPVQVTSDLANFWRSSYFDVRKELRGRYPKHHWPDDPLSAPPTNRAKRRGE